MFDSCSRPPPSSSVAARCPCQPCAAQQRKREGPRRTHTPRPGRLEHAATQLEHNLRRLSVTGQDLSGALFRRHIPASLTRSMPARATQRCPASRAPCRRTQSRSTPLQQGAPCLQTGRQGSTGGILRAAAARTDPDAEAARVQRVPWRYPEHALQQERVQLTARHHHERHDAQQAAAGTWPMVSTHGPRPHAQAHHAPEVSGCQSKSS